MFLLDKPAILVLAAVFLLIAIRQVGRFRLRIWNIMLAGAVTVLLLGSISPEEALRAINIDVMLFLFGMFIVGEALSQSGYLYRLSYRIFHRARSMNRLVLLILFGMGGLSALLMNDTLAIICTPLMLYFGRRHNASAKMLLLALAFGITTGSVLSPVGNPQNLLIAVEGKLASPFITFLLFLAIPTLLNLSLAYLALKLFYPRDFHAVELNHSREQLADQSMAKLCRFSLWLIAALIVLRIMSSFIRLLPDFSLTWIALLAAAPLLLVSRRRFQILSRIDWATLAFFASMFVLMEAVWRTGVIQMTLSSANWNVASLPVILGISVGVSQLISNVPFVALYLPALQYVAEPIMGMMALAAGSTIAGNLFILGAASNIIIIQNAEKQGETLTFWEFARIGLPLTVVQTLIYWLYLSLW